MKTLREADLTGQTVLVEMSLDVPIDNGTITDDARLRASLPTLQHLLEQDCRIIVCGHVGRPKGREPEKSTKPIAQALEGLLNTTVRHVDDITGDAAQQAAASLAPKEVLVLENLRYDEREEAADPAFAEELAALAEAFVNDDYPDAHRAHTTNTLVPRLLPSYAGFSLAAEHDAVTRAVHEPRKPFVLIVGGAKADKIGAINNLLHTADTIIVGGILANTFLAASGVDVKGSKIDERSLEIAGEFLRDAEEKFLLPVDVVAAKEFSERAEHKEAPLNEIPDKWMILDVGTQTVARYTEAIKEAGTVVWGGPIGVFEWEAFRRGTADVAAAVAHSNAYTLVGGGDSGAAVHSLGLEERIDHVSIGGGATLTLLGGEELPAVKALD